jgi:hypothetical protein
MRDNVKPRDFITEKRSIHWFRLASTRSLFEYRPVNCHDSREVRFWSTTTLAGAHFG